MTSKAQSSTNRLSISNHQLGVLSGLAAGAWLGAAEAPNKLVTAAGVSPILISLFMVVGVFAARWTVPTLLKGTSYIYADLREKPHLIVWAVLGGCLWAVGNTLSIYAIRDVGLSIAFPLWNANSLIGVLWGCVLFRELRGAEWKTWSKVLLGALAIVLGAVALGYASLEAPAQAGKNAGAGIAVALGAALMWGTMYIPYRKAYLSGMNPLSFVTVFILGEIVMMLAIALLFMGGFSSLTTAIVQCRSSLFWLFMGGFCWVIGDIFQQYAAKYVGISRGIPLSNTNQLWGLGWGGLVFGELSGHSSLWMVLAGSVVMIGGAAAISAAPAPDNEKLSWRKAVERECSRYGLNLERIEAANSGEDPLDAEVGARKWWDNVPCVLAVGLFLWLAGMTQVPPVAMDVRWAAVLLLGTFALLIISGLILWKNTRFS